MATFTRTPVRTVRTLGDHIRSARFAHGLTLDDVARTLVIQRKHLERIENNEFGAFREEVYLKNVLRMYSTYVGFEWEEVCELYRAAKPFYASARDDDAPSTLAPKVRASHFWVTPHIIRTGVTALIATACFSYIVFLGYRMMRAPELLIVSPYNNSLSAVNTIEVVGRVDTHAQVTINGEHVVKSEEGVFRQMVGLQEGVNVITVTAAKKFGQSRSEERTVIFSQKPFDESTTRSTQVPRALFSKKDAI
ncbi:helix-turn-helix domain-containing protein [Candidatus Uhrbacteria bacterium]|nr:helix-turn-helix domain-containing protein [Candidatus Uhrbacteria bacterium]